MVAGYPALLPPTHQGNMGPGDANQYYERGKQQ